jgi:hypothetical protein
MPELTLNDPLSGDEIKRIVLSRIESALAKDCTLIDDLAYAGFSVTFEIKIGYVRGPVPGTLVWGGMAQGAAVGSEGETASVQGEYKTEIPNAARQEHDLAIPVMVNTPSGPQKRRVRFQKAGEYAKTGE